MSLKQSMSKELVRVGEYSTLMADVTLYEGNLLHVKVKLDDELTLDIVKAHNEKSFDFLKERVVDVLFDVQEVSFLRVPNKVLRYWAEPNEYSQYVGKMAIILNSKIHTQMANFYVRVFQPVNPTRFFTDKDKAVEWIYEA
ncbi:MAG: STAS/SEC14 domain-containing protein [Bacteroidia bacterium]|jgi:hypothetical protein|nr:STAS/SEC14 domain-containing protein [Bacteroidia bacterium]